MFSPSCRIFAGQAVRCVAAHCRSFEAPSARATIQPWKRLRPELERSRGRIQTGRDAGGHPDVQQGRRRQPGRRPRHREGREPSGKLPRLDIVIAAAHKISTPITDGLYRRSCSRSPRSTRRGGCARTWRPRGPTAARATLGGRESPARRPRRRRRRGRAGRTCGRRCCGRFRSRCRSRSCSWRARRVCSWGEILRRRSWGLVRVTRNVLRTLGPT